MSRKIPRHEFSLLHVDHVYLDHKWNYNNVISPYFRIYYIDDGEGFVRYKNENIKLEKGFFYLVPSFTLCNLHCDNYLSQYFVHFFEDSIEGISFFENNRRIIKIPAIDTDIKLFTKLLEINPGRGINRSDNPKVYEKNAFYKSYRDLNSNASTATLLETQGIILILISRFLDSQLLSSKNIEPIPSKIVDTIGYIQLNISEHLTVDYLAQRINLHADYFSRVFLKATGIRPLNYIHEKRIERAQYLITTTNYSFSEIADQTGFDSLPHFSNIFKKITSLTPGEYKKQNELL